MTAAGESLARRLGSNQSAVDAASELGITTNAARLVKLRMLKRLKNGLADQPGS